jgi:hypothetical protein
MDFIHSVTYYSSDLTIGINIGFLGITNDHDDRETYICHPAYTDYITTNDAFSIDYMDVANWTMPERSFFDYLFHPRC